MTASASIFRPMGRLSQPEARNQSFDSGTLHQEKSRQLCALIPAPSAVSVSPQMVEPWLLGTPQGWWSSGMYRLANVATRSDPATMASVSKVLPFHATD